jgi:ethanolamine-phosphate phospho-lyase
MKQFFKDHFGLYLLGSKELVGYDNTNLLAHTNKGDFIFKTYPFDQNQWELVKAENEVLLGIKGNSTPQPFAFQDRTFEKVIEIEGQSKICRLLSFIPGEFLAEVPYSNKLAQNFGAFLADLVLKMSDYTPLAYKARKWEWDLQHSLLNKKYLKHISNPSQRKIVEYYFQQFEIKVLPIQENLRKALIHNDANEWNVLVQDNKITGIIDFGDVTYAPLINEVAVALTYLIYDKENPIAFTQDFIQGFHAIYPLQADELAVLYYLVAVRLCMSVCNSAFARSTQPTNDYTLISEEKAWLTLDNWLKTSPIYAETTFRKAINFPPIKSNFDQKRILQERKKHFATNLSISYERPVSIVNSAFQYFYDTQGNTILDAYNNIPCVGHCHPKITEVTRNAMAKLNTNTRYIYPELTAYAEKLLGKFPCELSKVFFVNSGSAASDLAIRLVKSHTKRNKIVVMEHGYHGNTQTSMEASDYKFNNPKGDGQKEHILKVEIPSDYRGKFANEDNSGEKYALKAIEQLRPESTEIAAFIAEPIVGCGGQVPLGQGYLKTIYPKIRAWGGLCISDEVQTGFGRIGEHFWGFQAHGVIPDIVILGKPIANGHPMGAVVCTREIADSFSNGLEFFSSFGGNPVSCAIATAVLDIIDEEKLQENALEVGQYFMQSLRSLQKNHLCIGDVRGSGLFLGIEMVIPPKQSPDTALAQLLKNELRNRNILVDTDGPFDNVIKSKPPMCFTKENVDTLVKAIQEILRQ